MRSKKIVNAVKFSIFDMSMFIFCIVAGICDFADWLDGSKICLWLGILMCIMAGVNFYLFKRSWAEFKALCTEIED